AFVLLFVRLSFWQVSRLHERQASNAVVRQHLAAPAIPYADMVELLPDDPGIAREQEWRAVQVTGRWDAAHQVLVRNRTLEGNAGYEVVTPLLPASGLALLVDRGWVVAGATPQAPGTVPAPQDGLVTVTARLRFVEPQRAA